MMRVTRTLPARCSGDPVPLTQEPSLTNDVEDDSRVRQIDESLSGGRTLVMARPLLLLFARSRKLL